MDAKDDDGSEAKDDNAEETEDKNEDHKIEEFPNDHRRGTLSYKNDFPNKNADGEEVTKSIPIKVSFAEMDYVPPSSDGP